MKTMKISNLYQAQRGMLLDSKRHPHWHPYWLGLLYKGYSIKGWRYAMLKGFLALHRRLLSNLYFFNKAFDIAREIEYIASNHMIRQCMLTYYTSFTCTTFVSVENKWTKCRVICSAKFGYLFLTLVGSDVRFGRISYWITDIEIIQIYIRSGRIYSCTLL